MIYFWSPCLQEEKTIQLVPLTNQHREDMSEIMQ